MTTLHRLIVISFVALLALPLTLGAQASFEQTLPAGYLQTQGNGGSFLPFNTTNDNRGHWQYAASQFAATGPVMINEVYLRSAGTAAVPQNFACAELEITLAEAATSFGSPAALFADNIHRGFVVRSGPYTLDTDTTSRNGVTGGWIPMRLQKSFLYDPSEGRDLIVGYRVCGVTTTLGVSISHQIVGTASRYAHSSDCNAAAFSFGPSTLVPIVKIDYTPVLEQTLPQGHLAANSNSATANPVNTNADQTWQWHYDDDEFQVQGPITITEVSIRANDASAVVNAFEFTNFEVTLAASTNDYGVAGHDPVFANNLTNPKVVRTGPWKAYATQASGGASSTWISFQLEEPYVYDPNATSIDGFVVEIRSCSLLTNWGTNLDGVSGPTGTVGGNRYGDLSSCTATSHSFSNDEFVPVIKISYVNNTVSSYPYTENFDHYGADPDTTTLPPGWRPHPSPTNPFRLYDRSHSTGTSPSDHSTNRTGLGFYLSSEDSGPVSNTDFVRTPRFDLTGLVNPIATFWVYSNSTLPPIQLDQNVLDVSLWKYSPSGNGASVFSTEVDQLGLIESGCWTKYSVDLASYSGAVVQLILLISTDSTNGFFHDIAIDDFRIGERFPSEGGQAPQAQASLDINDCWNLNGRHVDTGDDGPYYASGRAAGRFQVEVDSQAVFQPLALWVGPLNVGVATFPTVGQMDTGTPDVTGDGIPEGLFVFGSGLNTVLTPLDTFFFTDATGLMRLDLQINPFIPAGTFGAFQAVVADGFGGLFLSNAVVFDIVLP